MSSYRYAIGIDCGSQTGIAVWDRKTRKFRRVQTSTFWEVIYLLESTFNTAECRVWVEDPTQNNPVFKKEGADNVKKQLYVAQSVGKVKRETELLISGLERKGYVVNRIRPQKGSMTKLTSSAFKQYTKYTGRTSSHSRDAAMLVFGR